MAMDETLRAELMAYCRLDGLDSSEYDLLDEMYDDAVSQMEEAGVSEPQAGTPRQCKYNQCIKAIVLDSYDNRGTTSASAVADNPAFRRRMNQLKLTEPDPFPGSGSAASGEG